MVLPVWVSADVGSRSAIDRVDEVLGQADDHFTIGRGEEVDRRFHLRPHAASGEVALGVEHPHLVGRQLADVLEPFLPGPLTLGCSGVDFVEVTGAGVDKSLALAHVIEPLGFSAADVVAFGDNHNDLQMLSWAGHGVAVGNAVDAAKGAANEVIGHHRDNSVAAYIESLL